MNYFDRSEKPEINISNNNNINYNEFIQSGKIMEKFIVMNNENTIPKQKKIKEFEIKIKNKNSHETNLRRNKSNILKINIPKIKKPPNNEPYLKPKFLKKNKNSFSIKNKNKNNNNNNTNTNTINNINNEDVKNIYLNFFKVYYDENGKKVKIIKNKSNYKEDKSKEIILTQKNKNIIRNINTNLINDRNNKLRVNYRTEVFDKKNDNHNENYAIKTKLLSPETPTPSTTIDNKSNEKISKRHILGKELINNINKKIEILKKNNNNSNLNKTNDIIRKNIHYDNLPLFLKKRKNQKKKDKKKIIGNKNDFDDDNNNNGRKSFLEHPLNKLKKLKSDLVDQEILMTKLNNRKFNTNNNRNNERKIFLNNNMRKNHSRIDINHAQKINYFHNDISNLTLNMTFEQKNITNTINHTINNENNNIRNIYISSFKKKEIKKNNSKIYHLCLNDDSENGNLVNKTVNSGDNIGNYFLFNIVRDDNNNQQLNRNKSFGCQKINNYNLSTIYDFGKSNLHSQSNSFNNNIDNIKRFNYSNSFIGNDNENEISILNKTKEILKIKEDDLNKEFNHINHINHIKRKSVLDNSQPFLNSIFPNSIIRIKKNKYGEKLSDKISQKKINISPNIDYYQDSKIINTENQQNLNSITYNNIFNKNKRPCSLYINKKVDNNEKRKKNNCILNNYCNNAINKETHLNTGINNIFYNNSNSNLNKN